MVVAVRTHALRAWARRQGRKAWTWRGSDAGKGSEGAILLSTVCVKQALAWRIDGQEWPAYEGCRMQSEQLSCDASRGPLSRCADYQYIQLLYTAVAYSLNARHRLPVIFVRKVSVASAASTIVSCRT